MDTPAAEVAQEDPFAEAGGGDDPFADQSAVAAPEPPVVNKEGEPVEAAIPAGTQPVPAPEVAEAAAPAPDPAPPAPAAEGEGDDEVKDDEGDGKPLPRRYHVLYQTAPNQWTEHEWEGDGGEKTKIVKARNNDHALRQAFSLLGEPENGVTVLVVPVSGMKPKRLKRKAVVPRTALDIS